MKRIFTLLVAVLLTACVFAQLPEKMSYQAVIRNSSDILITNTQIGMEINIHQGTPAGTIVYTETQTPTTNANALVSIEIGGGAGFSTIDWSAGPYFIETKTAVVPPLTTYTITGTSQLLSVPYALYAEKSGSLSHPYVAGQGISINGDTINNTSLNSDNQTLFISGDTLFISNGNYVIIPTSPGPSFWNCGDTLIDSRDGTRYPTVQIGGQCWMKTNLIIGTMINASTNQSNNSILEKYCYDNTAFNSLTLIYGGLYQWDEAMQYVTTQSSKGVCPTGWHVPSSDEWTDLESYLINNAMTIGDLKETGTTHWNAPNTGATNSTGFTAVPGGGSNNGSFYNKGYKAVFWSSTEDNSTIAVGYGINYNSTVFDRTHSTKANGYSIRCLKD